MLTNGTEDLHVGFNLVGLSNVSADWMVLRNLMTEMTSYTDLKDFKTWWLEYFTLYGYISSYTIYSRHTPPKLG